MAPFTDHPLARLEPIALVAIGGFVGANVRFLALGELSWIQAVLLANVVGSTLLGFVLAEATTAGILGRRTRLFVTTGFLSSLTTYSTFAVQTATAGGPALALGIVAANYGLGFAGVVIGRTLASRLLGGEP